MLRKLIPILLILSLVSPPVVHFAQAGVLDSTIGFSSCTTAGFISNLISDGLVKLEKFIKDTIKGWLTRKVLPSKDISFIIGLGGNSVPVIDKEVKGEVTNVRGAVNDFKGVYTGKETVQDLIARCGAREILTAMGKNITNVARTGGRDGGPAWVRNWRNFQLESHYRGEGIFRGMLASTNLCNYFGPDLKETFRANQKVNLTKIKTRSDLDSFQVKAGCTLPSNFDINKYKKDFSGNGGWEAWSRLLQPQNNYYGALFLSLDEASRQRAIEETAALNEAGPSGFTSIRGRNAAGSCAIKSPADGRCLIYKDILTPASIISGGVQSGIEAELQWVASTDELNELIATGIEVLINRLWDLSNPDEGDYIVPGNVDVSILPFPESPESGGPGGSGGVCADTGSGVPNYTGNLQAAINTIITNNPDGIADALNTTENSLAFLNFVAQELQSSGFNATTNVLNGNDNLNKGDLIAVWQNSDSILERYDAIIGVGDGDKLIRDATAIQFTGDIPLSCAGGGGGGGGGDGGEESPPEAL